RLERSRPESLELSGRAREDDDDAAIEVENEPRCRSGETERDGALGSGRLLPHPRAELLVRAAKALRDHPRDRPDLLLERGVDDERAIGDLGYQLDGPVVVRRTEAARHE